MRWLYLVLATLMVIPLSLASQVSNQYSYNILEAPTFNNNTAFVNATNIWKTNLGDLENGNATQFEGGTSTLSIKESWVNSLWCRLTGCTMSGNINMNFNDIQDVANITVQQLNGNFGILNVIGFNDGADGLSGSGGYIDPQPQQLVMGYVGGSFFESALFLFQNGTIRLRSTCGFLCVSYYDFGPLNATFSSPLHLTHASPNEFSGSIEFQGAKNVDYDDNGGSFFGDGNDVKAFFDGANQYLKVFVGTNANFVEGFTHTTFDHNVTVVNMSADFYLGDGSQLTNLPNAFDQDLNTIDNVSFINLTSNGVINISNTSDSTHGVIIQNGDTLIHTYGDDNLFIGGGAGDFGLTGSSLVGVGAGSLRSVTTGSNSLGVGAFSLRSMSSGQHNLGLGGFSLPDLTIGSGNSCGGAFCLFEIVDGSSNTCFGRNCGVDVGDSTYGTTLLGAYTMDSTQESTSSNNHMTVVGTNAAGKFGYNSDPDFGTIVGSGAGYYVDGDGVVYIGYRAGRSKSGSNHLMIDNSDRNDSLIYGEFDTRELIFHGEVNITQNLTVEGNVSAEDFITWSWVYDKEELGNSLDYIIDSDNLRNIDGKHNDSKYPDYRQSIQKLPDRERAVEVVTYFDLCEEDYDTGKIRCFNESKTTTTYPYSVERTGTSLVKGIATHDQQIYDLVQIIESLVDRIEVLEAIK